MVCSIGDQARRSKAVRNIHFGTEVTPVEVTPRQTTSPRSSRWRSPPRQTTSPRSSRWRVTPPGRQPARGHPGGGHPPGRQPARGHPGGGHPPGRQPARGHPGGGHPPGRQAGSCDPRRHGCSGSPQLTGIHQRRAATAVHQ